MNKLFNELFKKFMKDSCMVRASGLAYSSLLAMVPFITVIFAFGGFDTLGQTLEELIIDSLIPTQQEAILKIINNFTRNSLATGTLGTIFFLITTLFLINTIARNFDAIWGVEIKVGIFKRFTTYTAILVFISLLLGISTSLTDTVEGYISSVGIYSPQEYKDTISIFIPFLLTLFTFFTMLLVIPSAKVKFKSAVVGAVISAILFELIKILFKFWALYSVQTSVIYGSLSIIPIFLVGLYLFWLFILIGVEITFFVQHKNNAFSGGLEEMNIEDQLAISFEIFISIASSYRSKNFGGYTSKELESKIGISSNVVDHFLSELLNHGLLLKVSGKKSIYIPGRSLDKIYLKDITEVIYGGSSCLNNINNISKINSKGFFVAGFNSLDNRSILELIGELDE